MKLDRACSRCWMEVDEDALRENYHLARSLCHADTQFICVVKADAYGLGLFRTVQTLRSAGAPRRKKRCWPGKRLWMPMCC